MNFVITNIACTRSDVIYRGSSYMQKTPRVSHTLVYFMSGRLKYTAKRKEYTVGEGDILLIHRGTIDRSESITDSTEYCFCDFDVIDDEYLKKSFNTPVKVANKEFIHQSFRVLMESFNKTTLESDIKAMQMLYGIFGKLAPQFSEDNDYYNTKYRKIEKAVYTIKTDFMNTDICERYLAELCGMSISNMNLLFKQLLNTTPKKYLVAMRMENAKYLINKGVRRVSEIAVKCGYEDVYSFSRAFKNYYKCPPSKMINS